MICVVGGCCKCKSNPIRISSLIVVRAHTHISIVRWKMWNIANPNWIENTKFHPREREKVAAAIQPHITIVSAAIPSNNNNKVQVHHPFNKGIKRSSEESKSYCSLLPTSQSTRNLTLSTLPATTLVLSLILPPTSLRPILWNSNVNVESHVYSNNNRAESNVTYNGSS